MKKPALSIIYAFILAALFSLLTVFTYKFFLEQKTEEHILLSLWQKDIQLLKNTNYLPKEWHNIGSLKIYANTPKAKEWLKIINPPINVSSKGAYELEVLIISFESKGVQKSIIQYDLLDPKKNVIWELGRTFKLGPIQEVN